MSTIVRPAVSLIVLMTLITGMAYPLLVTGVAQVAFPEQANGSLVYDEQEKVRGSELIAQDFTGEQWFHSRPSAGSYATVASGASNLAPSNPALAARVADDVLKEKVEGQGPVPLNLLTTSASGLDPHLSPAAAQYQVARVAQARHLPREAVQRLVVDNTYSPLIGPPVVNVLALNQGLSELPATTRTH
ncbi:MULTISPECIES: potassium-transporting ATPase subunit KdpC [unclassified Pseudomonas]|uniref:potassium-transporting ATPase subunit KdpC n=1 Tax=unclassified Pseudomonas TaxID=196821 RepID=UPI0025CE1E05|nr:MULTISPECIES: potassium-transporting ATPase subunit KdpC [unclassified Pseudomonas]